MLIILATLVVLIALWSFRRVARRSDAANLGWMSQQWLAEHRALHPL
jgi:hypothetical protein